jgi:hypothetical protein
MLGIGRTYLEKYQNPFNQQWFDFQTSWQYQKNTSVKNQNSD